MTLVIVNSPLYGGSGGAVATFSTHASAAEIALHEMGHTAFGLADEYESYAGCASGETDHNNYVGGEPVEPNVTLNTNRNTIKWKSALTSPADALPTTVNANCAQCDTQANPKPAGYVGAYTGARYYHCGCYRPAYDCRMRTLGQPFCAVCQGSSGTRCDLTCPRPTRACGGRHRRAPSRAGESISRTRATRSSRPGSPTTPAARRGGCR